MGADKGTADKGTEPEVLNRVDSEVLDDDGGGEDEEGDKDEEGGEDEDDDDDGVVWEEMLACPLIVRFTQEKIHPFFYRRGPIENVLPRIRATLCPGDLEPPIGVSQSEVARGNIAELLPPFGPIHCLRKGKRLWSLDNRRLYALQLRAMELWPTQCCVRLLASDRLARKKFKTQYRKFKTQTEGQMVRIESKYQLFKTWSWFEEAVNREIEDTISRQLGMFLSIFEALPVIGALLFRTGLTGLTSRTPLIIAFLLTFGMDFVRQKVPACEKKVASLHVKAIMDGDVKYCPSCGSREADNGYEPNSNSLSAPQLAATMALLMVLTLPYVSAINHDKIRSSVFSCWLGISCVLMFQLANMHKTANRPIEALAPGPEDEVCFASPKHRD